MKKMFFIFAMLLNLSICCSDKESKEEKKESKEEKKINYLTNTPKTEIFLKKILQHKTLCPKVFAKSQGLPDVIQNEILKYLIKNYSCFKTIKYNEMQFNSRHFPLCNLSNGFFAASSNDTIKIFNANGECIQTIKTSSSILSLCYLKGEHLASITKNGLIQIWNFMTGKSVQKTEDFNHSFFGTLCYLANGNLVSTSDYGTITIWSYKDKKLVKQKVIKDSHSFIVTLCALPNGNLATGSFDKTIKIWNPDSGKCLHTLIGHNSAIKFLHMLNDKLLIAGSNNGIIKIWDVNNGECVQTLPLISDIHFRITNFCVSQNNKLILGSKKGIIKILDLKTGELIQEFKAHEDEIINFCLLSNGSLISNSLDGTIKIWSKTFDTQKKAAPLTLMQKFKLKFFGLFSKG